MLASRVRQIGFSPTLAVNDLARRMRADGVDLIDFSAGQPDFPTPERVKDAAKRALDADRTGYTATAGVPELRQAIVDAIRRERGIDYAPEDIVVSPGAKASLYFACQALLDPGDEVLVPSPYWTSYPEQIALAGGETRYVDCPESTGFRLEPEALERAVTARTKAVILNYPNNPTGASYGAEELRRLAEVCVRHDIWVLADEIYSRLLYGEAAFTSIASFGDEIRNRTVLIDGVSKTYSMTGWRIGYAAGPRELIAGMTKLQSHSTSNATSISQWASIEALGLEPAEIAPRIAEFDRRREEIVRRLRALDGIRCVEPQGAFYVFPNVAGCFRGEIACGQALARYLIEHARVAVVPGEAFGSADHIRLSYALPYARMCEGLDRIAAALTQLRA